MPAVSGRHALDCFAGAQHGPQHIHGQHALQALGRHLVEARGHVHNAGVADQTGQRGQVGIGLRKEFEHIGFVRQVGLNGLR